MKITEGNRVKLINENFEGVISKILPQKRLIVTCMDGFDYEVSINDVIIIGEDNSHLYAIDDTELSKKTADIIKGVVTSNNSKGILSKYLNKSKFAVGNTLEIDLHLEQLVDHPEGLDDWQRIHTQIQHVKNCLSAAMDKNIKKIVFIHGVGTGVLKTELHNYLSSFNYLAVSEADFREYGSGATLVIINN